MHCLAELKRDERKTQHLADRVLIIHADIGNGTDNIADILGFIRRRILPRKLNSGCLGGLTQGNTLRSKCPGKMHNVLQSKPKARRYTGFSLLIRLYITFFHTVARTRSDSAGCQSQSARLNF